MAAFFLAACWSCTICGAGAMASAGVVVGRLMSAAHDKDGPRCGSHKSHSGTWEWRRDVLFLPLAVMLESVELVELESNDDDEKDETCSLISGLTDHTKDERFFLTTCASPYNKTLLSMQMLATERRRQSLCKVLMCVVLLIIGLVGVVSIQYPRHGEINKVPEIDSSLSASNATMIGTAETAKNSTLEVAPIDIIVQMSGEMGNHLSKLASGVGVSLYLRDFFALESNIRLRHQDRTDKWRSAVSFLQECFPFAKRLNFSEAQAYQPLLRTNTIYDGINDTNETTILVAIEKIGRDAQIVQSSPITVYSDHLVLLCAYLDRYYDIYREYFAMDLNCCAMVPNDDEIVLHMRLFTKEMPRKGVQKGYEEISPKDLIEQVLLPYETNRNKKIAILSRYPDHLDAYVQALDDAGWSVRIIANQTTTQDFCFLMHSQNTMIGSVRSTFFFWAAVLSDTAEQVLAYSIDSPAKRAWAEEHNTSVLESYPFRNLAIRKKFQFPLFVAT